MRVSSRGQYGVRALAYLAAHYGEGPINVRTIAEAEHLPAKYLEQLLARLRRGGLVRSNRGARGGVLLARAPEGITVRQVVEWLEGSLAPVECLERRSEHDEDCVPHTIWQRLHESVLGALDSFTLADLAGRLRAREERRRDKSAAPEAPLAQVTDAEAANGSRAGVAPEVEEMEPAPALAGLHDGRSDGD